MEIAALYSEWADRETLTPTELTQVLEVALRTSNGRTIRDVLAQKHCSDGHVQLVRNSQDPTALSLWLTSRQATQKDLTEFLRTTEVELLCRTLNEGGMSLEERELKVLWKRGETRLRYEVLRRVRWHLQPPTTWGRWLMETRPFPELGVPEQLVFQSLAESAPDHTWKVALASGDLQVLTWVFEALPDREARPWHASGLQEVALAHLEKAPSSPEELSALVEAVGALVRSRRSQRGYTLAGSSEAALALDVLARLDEGPDRDALRAELAELQLDSDVPRTREELIEALRGGELPLAAVAGGQQAGPGDELWDLVATHPQLTPRDANELVKGLDRWDQRAELDTLLAKRRPTWLRDLAALVWEGPAYLDEQVRHVAGAVPTRQRSRLMLDLVRADPRNAARMVKLGLATDEALGALPLDEVKNVSKEVRSALLGLTRRGLGDDPVRWEIFESLAGEFTGTYGELVQAARSLAQAPGAGTP